MAKMHPFWRLIPPPCPSGEQMQNGGFELGNDSGWVVIQGWDEIVTDDVHSGAYSCKLGYMTFIRQTLVTPILVRCVSVFELWARRTSAYSSGLFTIIVHYSNGTTSSASYYAPFANWQQFDLKPILESGKTMDYVEIQARGDSPYTRIDDVSILGSG